MNKHENHLNMQNIPWRKNSFGQLKPSTLQTADSFQPMKQKKRVKNNVYVHALHLTIII